MVMTACAGATTAVGDRLPALWRCIEDAHYSYLETDDSPEKLQQRKKLEGYIMEYLSLVPHEYKFGLAETAKVFQRTISELGEFSAYRAGLGWAALGRYAGNLLSQPWRKEYRTIRLYCGYYKHEIEANLVGAEILVQQMGYRPDGVGRLSLDGPVCPDMVAAISRDALIAHVECQIMVQVWEAVWGAGARVSWAEVARARARRVGGAAAAAAALAAPPAPPAPPAAPAAHDALSYADDSEIYSNIPATVLTEPYHQNMLPELTRHPPCNHMCSPEESPLEESTIPMLHQPYIGPAHHIMPPNMMYAMPPHHLHGEVPITMAQCNPMPMMSPYGPMPYYYTAVQTPYMLPTTIYAPIKHAATVPINGYPPMAAYRYPAVPTAQLIELDAPSVYENGSKHKTEASRSHMDIEDRGHSRKHRSHIENSARNSTSKSGFSDVSLPSIPRSDTQPALSKAREDGMGTYESWDYVFRNLSNKEHDVNRSRFSPSLERDSRTLDRLDRDERRIRYQPTTLDLEDGLQAMNLDRSYDDDVYRTAKVNENLMRIKQESEVKKAKHLAKKQAAEKMRKKIGTQETQANLLSDGLINTNVAPDKVRLLTKKDVKERKEVIKQQNSVNGSVKMNVLNDVKKRKSSKSSADGDVKPVKSKAQLENGTNNVHSMKNVPGSSNANSAPHHGYDAKTHLIVSLDETDTVRRSPPNGERERPSRNPSRQNGVADPPTELIGIMKKEKWECVTCTYINNSASSACEMCGKSRRAGPEVLPLTSGGRECPACTLVNERDATKCEACATDLKHCPTYI